MSCVLYNTKKRKKGKKEKEKEKKERTAARGHITTMSSEKPCVLCSTRADTILVTNTIRPRLLFHDETNIYLKQEEIDDRHYECDRCGSLCFKEKEKEKEKETDEEKINQCCSVVEKRPLFSMSFYAVRICRPCFATGPVLGGTV